MILIKSKGKNFSKGFTLVEILIVISIIGILSNLVLLQLGAARAKARDVKRISDVSQIKSAEELFFDDNGRYSQTTNLTSDLVTIGKYLSLMPVDPLTTTCSDRVYDGSGCYGYAWNLASSPIRFHIWAELERISSGHKADLDFDSIGWANGGTTVNGTIGDTCPDTDVTNTNCVYDLGQTQ